MSLGGLTNWRFALTLFCLVTGLAQATHGFAADFELQGGFSTDVGTATYSFVQLGVETRFAETLGCRNSDTGDRNWPNAAGQMSAAC